MHNFPQKLLQFRNVINKKFYQFNLSILLKQGFICMQLTFIVTVTTLFVLLPCCWSEPCNIEDYGAKGNNRTVNTHNIQKAIDECNSVYIPSGTFKTGKLHLHTNLTIEIAPDGILIGDPLRIYKGAMINARNCNNLYFTGGGRIESGKDDNHHYKLLEFINCDNIKFFNFSIYQNTHDWCFLCENCYNFELDQFQLHGYNGRDGLDLVGCKNVFIQNSLLLGSDDALALKANTTIDSIRGKAYDTYNVTVQNCEIASKDDNALQFGSETPGNFSFISFYNITISSAGKAGIGITSNDGGYIQNVIYNNITMDNIATPFWIKLTNRTPPVGRISDIYISNVSARRVFGFQSSYHENLTSTLDGFDHNNLLGPNIVFSNISIEYLGGGALCAVDISPPDPDTDYRPRYLGPRPSYGFYIRHAQGVSLYNVSVSYKWEDLRPPFYLDDTFNILFHNVSGEISSNSLSPTCAVVIQSSGNFSLENSNLLPCAFSNYPPCPHQVYYYSHYDY